MLEESVQEAGEALHGSSPSMFCYIQEICGAEIS